MQTTFCGPFPSYHFRNRSRINARGWYWSISTTFLFIQFHEVLWMFLTIGAAFDFPKLFIKKLEISLFTPSSVTDEDSESNRS